MDKLSRSFWKPQIIFTKLLEIFISFSINMFASSFSYLFDFFLNRNKNFALKKVAAFIEYKQC